ncbi:type I glyceraldehyde-3-phosphate dehydrogenase [Desulfovibrio sp. OttesenSCG-928-F20]|nr:type I glyceraldehyde-3-phosphate dehydrogenase [Desulfovibrio sp. OttesenSCG-928-M16]MDL2290855.1 type I glyceraldehyde-3-phosphate dehydrogenase [Desulfovibrio sp. OttesenSCG-928-F20]
MPVNIGINGFGRIGRYLLRLLADDPELAVTAVNARADNASLAHLFRYDSVHRTFGGKVEVNDAGFMVNDRQVRITRHAPGDWQWGDLGVDMVVETTGTLKDGPALAKHIQCGAKKSIISAPGSNVDITVVMGVNHKDYKPAEHHVVSNASCTTNCMAPATKVLHDNFGIRHGMMTTVHSYTMSQRILDGSHKDLRRARAAAVSMIPTTTGAAKAIALVIPELRGKLDGMAVRVPTPNVSLVDLTCELERDTSVEEVNAVLKAAAEDQMKDFMGFTEEPLVSCDFIGSTFGGVIDAACTHVIGRRMLKLVIWYDNESGFTNQLVRLLRMMGRGLPQ